VSGDTSSPAVGDSEPRYVLLADVVASRELDDRERFKTTLSDALASANDQFDDELFVPVEPIKGVDEFGGVLVTLSPVYELLATILDRIHPVRVRFAVTSAEIDVGANEHRIADMDGPAFHRGDELLHTIEEDDLYAAVDTNRPADGLVSPTINLLLLRREALTDRQLEVIRAYERHGTQSAAAEELDVPQQAVSQALQRAEYDRTMLLRQQLRETLEVLYE